MIIQKIDLGKAYEIIASGTVRDVHEQYESAYTIKSLLRSQTISSDKANGLLESLFLEEQARVLSCYDHLLKSADGQDQLDLVTDQILEEVRECMQDYVDIVTL